MEVQNKNSRMLTTTEVAHLLHVHPNSVRQWANKGLLPVYRLGTRGDRRFKWKEVENFIKSNSHKSQ
jgi:excisionase family DNA binding protein